MQQTEKYQLNLIDPSDEFSPDPLNANARAVEAQLAALEADAAAIHADLGVHGYNCRMAYGTYTGQGNWGAEHPNTFTFDFYPVCLIVADPASTAVVFIRDCPSCTPRSLQVTVQWQENGLSWYTSYQDSQLSVNGRSYSYIALGYDPEN